MRVLLAPMEGVVDHTMRDLLTRLGGYDRCVTEFIRVSQSPLPGKVFRRFAPELDHGGRTAAGVPVFVQLLGGHMQNMARSAANAAAMGAPGIDLNFGCPAKVVNRHDGGSALLREPARVGGIVDAVRQAVDPAIPVCAKIRLGFEDSSLFPDIAAAAAAAGASELCVHARTRIHGYKPPAHWHEVGQIKNALSIPIIINGEIWSPADVAEARRQSGCNDIMLGRGALAWPDLARLVKAGTEPGGESITPLPWESVAALLAVFFQRQDSSIRKYIGNRTKQWLGYLRRRYPEASSLFREIKRSTDAAEIAGEIEKHCGKSPATYFADAA